jgi:hypothetical protein
MIISEFVAARDSANDRETPNPWHLHYRPSPISLQIPIGAKAFGIEWTLLNSYNRGLVEIHDGVSVSADPASRRRSAKRSRETWQEFHCPAPIFVALAKTRANRDSRGGVEEKSGYRYIIGHQPFSQAWECPMKVHSPKEVPQLPVSGRRSALSARKRRIATGFLLPDWPIPVHTCQGRRFGKA